MALAHPLHGPISTRELVPSLARGWSSRADRNWLPKTAAKSDDIFRYAFELLVGRGSISREQCRAIQTQLQEDIDSHRLTQFALDLERVFTNASEIARTHTAKSLARSLDLLDIAAAHSAPCTTLVSADDRQLAVVKATGLRTVDIKRGSGGRRLH